MDVLIYVEDPGAANFAADLPGALQRRGRTAGIWATGRARDLLAVRDVKFAEPTTLDAARPRLLLAGTAEDVDTLGLRLIDEARARGIPSIGLVDGPAHSGRRFRGRGDTAFAHAPDWLLVPDPVTRDEYAGLGYPADRIRLCGHPHCDFVRRERRRLEKAGRPAVRAGLLPQAPPDRRVVVFADELSTGLDPIQFRRSPEYTLHGSGRHDGRTEIVLEEFLDALGPAPYRVLRLHPKTRREDLRGFLDRFDQVSQGGSPLDLVFTADAVVGMTSMILVEAALLGSPTVSILPRRVEAKWLATIAAGVTPCATRREEIEPALRLVLDGPRPDPARCDTIWPEGATDRIVDFLEERLRA